MTKILPQKAVVAKRLLSRGGAHLAQIPWQAGYDTPWRTQQTNRGLGNTHACCGGWRGGRGKNPRSTCACRHALYLNKALTYPDQDDAAVVAARSWRDQHVEGGRGHDREAKHPSNARETKAAAQFRHARNGNDKCNENNRHHLLDSSLKMNENVKKNLLRKYDERH